MVRLSVSEITKTINRPTPNKRDVSACGVTVHMTLVQKISTIDCLRSTENREKKQKNSRLLDQIFLLEPAEGKQAWGHDKLTIFVLTSFSIALTSSAALGTSAELCREARSTDDYRTAGQEERH